MTNLTATTAVTQFIHKTQRSDIPASVAKRGVQAIIDGLACMLAGAESDVGTVLQQWSAHSGTGEEATIVGASGRTSAPVAALVNGSAGHALDYDDTQLSSKPDRTYGLLTHPTIPPLAAALAVSDLKKISAADFLAAFVIGVEVSCTVAEAMDPDHYLRGFHSTGTIGVFGATATACKLLGLSEEQIRAALGIAASQPTGIRANFGTMMKPFHAGRAAENGLVAAQLASHGYSGDPNALDGRWGYLQVAGGPRSEPEWIIAKLGNPFSLVDPGVSIKPYPCGSLGHPTMDTFLDMVIAEDLQPEQVEKITVRAGSNILDPLRYARPTNELEAKFSLPFSLSVLLLKRRAGLAEFQDDIVNAPDVRANMELVELIRDQGIEDKGFDRMRSRIEIELKDGRTLAQDADVSRGSPDRPMSTEEIFAKFDECARESLASEKRAACVQHLQNFEALDDMGVLLSVLSG